MSCLRLMVLYGLTTIIILIFLVWRYYGIQMHYPENMHIVKSHQPLLSYEHQFKNIFPVAIFWVRIANSIMHDTDLAGVGLMSTRHWPFVGVWQWNSYGIANVRWRPGSRLWGHYWICQLLKHPTINQFTWSSKSSATTWYVQNRTTIIVPNVHINHKSSLVKIMACHRISKKTTNWTSNDANNRCRYVSPGLNVRHEEV